MSMRKRTKRVEIKEIFEGLQRQMESKLTLNKKVLLHPVEKGDASELEWVDMLSTYLPKRYSVSKAHVIDHEGNYSEQIDIVIFDRHYSPFILKQNGATYIPAECVYAVLEVKPSLTRANLEYASEKALSVRKLKRTSAKIIQADGADFNPKKPPKIIAGLLTINGSLSKQGDSYLKNLPEDRCLNIGCALSGKYFKIKNFHPWRKNGNPYRIEHRSGTKSLIIFFLNLLIELQKMGTVPAIELEKYMKDL
jgi:hypothetical protein